MTSIAVYALVCYAIYIRNPIIPILDKRRYNKVLDDLVPTRWEFFDDKFTVSNDLVESELKWAVFKEVIIHSSAVFLYGSTKDPIFLRRKYFKDVDDYHKLISKLETLPVSLRTL